jgi:hypothetical protein
MKATKNIARLAVTAGLTAALSFGGVMAPVTMAFAAEGTAATANTITINKNENNGDVKYKAYQIFEADVVDESGKTGKTDKVVSNVKWATGVNDTTQKAIIKAINDYNKDEADDLTTDASPQDVANWLTANITGTTNTTVLKDTDLLNTLAGLVAKNVNPTNPTGVGETSFGAGTKVSFDKSGYYLFLTDADTLASDKSTTGSKNTATSPIYAVVGAGDVEVTEKTSIPTVNKEVREGATWGKVSDSYIGEEVEYKLTGSVASNIDTFTKYEYTFQDHLSVGLEAIKSSVTVTINGQVIQPANGYTVDLVDTKNASGNLTGGQDLTISFSNLKDAAEAAGVTLRGDSKVVVTYKAKLTDKAEYTAAGNTNEVKLVYSNDPMSNGTGTSESKKVADYVFGFDVTKIDPDNSSAKLDAGFTVKMIKEGSDKSVEKWLKKDGSFSNDVNDAYTFETTEAGNKVSIPGLVAGTYLISESKTPAGYNTIADFEITVAPEYNTDGTLKKLNVTSNSSMAAPTTDENVTTTKIPVTIKNKKGSGLPLTGLNGVTFTWIAGGAVLVIGVAHLIRSRKQAEESEQE